MGYLFLIIIITLIIYYSYDYIKKQIPKQSNSYYKQTIDYNNLNSDIDDIDFNFIPYTKKFLLTRNEYYFYKNLKPIADELNLCVLAKIRLADIVEPQKTLNKSDWYKYFAKIKAKHIDFALCNPDNLSIVLILELNDNSHNSAERKQRDIFIENILNKTNIPFLQVYGNYNLKEKIINKLNFPKQ